MPAAGPLGNQHGCAVDVNGNINATLPHLMASDTQGDPLNALVAYRDHS